MRMRLLFLVVAMMFGSSYQFERKSGDQNQPPRGGGGGYSTGMGPYDIEVKILRVCDDTGTGEIKFVVEPYNTKTNGVSKILYRGNFTTPFTQEQLNALNVTLTVYKKKDNKYFTVVKYENNFREACKDEAKDIYLEISNKVGLDGNDDFIIPKGVYSFNDWEVDLHFPPPVLEYGYYKGIFVLLHENKICTCLEVFAEIKQKN